MCRYNSVRWDSQIIFGVAGPEWSEADGKCSHAKDDEDAAIKLSLVLVGAVDEEFSLGMLLLQFEHLVSRVLVVEGRNEDVGLFAAKIELGRNRPITKKAEGAVGLKSESIE